MEEPTPPRLEDYGLTEENLQEVEGIVATYEKRQKFLVVIGAAVGGLILVFFFLSLDSTADPPPLLPMVFIFFSGMVFTAAPAYWVAPIIYFLFLGKNSLMHKVQSYKRKQYDYERRATEWQNYEKLAQKAERLKQAEERKRQQRITEYENLQSDWERAIHSTFSERDRFLKDGVLRIKGTKLLSLIDWRQFEVVLAHILRHRGWQARTTSRGADGGVDVEGTRGTQKLYLQAKHFRSGNVGRPALHMLMGVTQSKGATHAILATSSDFTRQAKDEPTNNLSYSLELWDGRKVATLIDALSTEIYEEMIEPMKRDLLRSL